MATPQFMPFPNADAERPFSPVEDEPPLRWQRAVHLAPANGLGVARRAIFFALLTWLPIALWAFIRGRSIDAATGEPLLQHYGVHVRCLVAIPMFILGEATLNRAGLRAFPQFISSGLVDDTARPRFEAAVQTVRRWRHSTLPWLFLIGAAVTWTLVDHMEVQGDEMSWALDRNGTLGFGGVWFAYVVRPIFVALVLGWLWRIGTARAADRPARPARSVTRTLASGSRRWTGLSRETAWRVRARELRALGIARVTLGAPDRPPRPDPGRVQDPGDRVRRRVVAAVARPARRSDASASRDETGGIAVLRGHGR